MNAVMQRLYHEPSPESGSRMSRRLRDADVTSEHLTGLRWWVGGGLGLSTGVALMVGWVAASAVLVGVAMVPALVVAARSGHRQTRIVGELANFTDTMGRSLRSGASFRQALVESHNTTSPVLAELLDPVVQQARSGGDISPALTGMVRSLPVREVRLVAATLAVGSEHDTGIGQALAGVTETLRNRAALRDEVAGLATQALASMRALLILPPGFLLFDHVIGGTALGFLFSTAIGRLCLAAGCGLNVVGWWWMKWVIRRRFPT